MLICVFYERPADDMVYVPKYQTVYINTCYISVQGMNRIYEVIIIRLSARTAIIVTFFLLLHRSCCYNYCFHSNSCTCLHFKTLIHINL